MDNETKAWIVIGIGGIISIADLIFGILSKGEIDLLLIVTGIAFLYLLVKSAIKEALKEHDWENR